MPKIHIGKKIREVVDKSTLTIVEFAKSINLSRDGVYKIFMKEYIDTDQLKQISKVLKHDFFSYYSADLSEIKEPQVKYSRIQTEEIENLKRMIERLEKKIDERLPERDTARKKNGNKEL
jgi:predicted transcriptional regulator